MKKVAVLDIGTNSMRLLLCETENKKIGNRTKELIVTRIGHNVSASGIINEKAMERNINALKYFKKQSERYGAAKLIAIATSAVRDASNKEEFLERARCEANVNVHVISGQVEARLGIVGAMCEIEDDESNILVIDIGGGSTELILGTKKEIEYSTSINAGTVRMTERFVEANPIPNENITAMSDCITQLFWEALSHLKTRKIDMVIGIGGTATTTAAMYHNLEKYDQKIVHNTIVGIEYIDSQFIKLSKMNLTDRYNIKGLQKERADVIPAGLCIMKHILNVLNIDKITVSENDNLEGAVVEYMLET